MAGDMVETLKPALEKLNGVLAIVDNRKEKVQESIKKLNAYAMSLGHELGSITPGKKANLIITRPLSSLAYLPYAFGSDLIDQVMIGGEFIRDRPLIRRLVNTGT